MTYKEINHALAHMTISVAILTQLESYLQQKERAGVATPEDVALVQSTKTEVQTLIARLKKVSGHL